MSPKLRALLVAAGLVVSGGAALQLFVTRPGVSRGDLADAGVAECTPVVVRLQMRVPRPDKQGALRDAGLDVEDLPRLDGGTKSRRFAQVLTRARLCGDAGLVLPFESEDVTLYGAVEFLSDAGAGPARPQLDEQCGCRRRGSPCRQRSDGGLLPFDTELAPGTFVGAGCVRKTCGEVAGEQGESMPEACK